MKYYRTRIKDITDGEVRQVFIELNTMVGWPREEQFNLRLYEWFSLFFNHWAPAKLTARLIPYQCALTTKIHKLAGTEVHTMYKELCRERRYGVEEYETGTLLTFLKRVYKPSRR
ncbi:MAG: hypothetical protein KDK97_17195 [Verrucomicrobiales bacterium]|nr:hypothetical protein [Verrucomicrobiales bacterium]MCP5557289.1 hypothetical protein [Verrucomicrobiaceae bacterium]